MRAGVSFVALALALSLYGCASFTPRQVAEPSGVTLERAVKDVAASIDYLQTRPMSSRAGLLLDEVTVTFHVAASANAKNNSKLTLSATPGTGVSLGGEAGTELTNDAERGNVIIMKFKNLATADYSKGSFRTPGTGDYPGSGRVTQRNPGGILSTDPGAPNAKDAEKRVGKDPAPGPDKQVRVEPAPRADTGGGGGNFLSKRRKQATE